MGTNGIITLYDCEYGFFNDAFYKFGWRIHRPKRPEEEFRKFFLYPRNLKFTIILSTKPKRLRELNEMEKQQQLERKYKEARKKYITENNIWCYENNLAQPGAVDNVLDWMIYLESIRKMKAPIIEGFNDDSNDFTSSLEMLDQLFKTINEQNNDESSGPTCPLCIERHCNVEFGVLSEDNRHIRPTCMHYDCLYKYLRNSGDQYANQRCQTYAFYSTPGNLSYYSWGVRDPQQCPMGR